jgi:regulator of RNase E activity RraA
VATGDLVVGDADGVVTVPRARLAQVGTALAAVRAAEQRAEAAVRDGAMTLPEIAELLASSRVRWLD